MVPMKYINLIMPQALEMNRNFDKAREKEIKEQERQEQARLNPSFIPWLTGVDKV